MLCEDNNNCDLKMLLKRPSIEATKFRYMHTLEFQKRLWKFLKLIQHKEEMLRMKFYCHHTTEIPAAH